MEVEEILQRISQARDILREVRDKTSIPFIERCMYLADMNLHWARWCLGEMDEIAPELEP